MYRLAAVTGPRSSIDSALPKKFQHMKTQKTTKLTISQNRTVQIENVSGRILVTLFSSDCRTIEHYRSIFHYLKTEGFLTSTISFNEVEWAAPSCFSSKKEPTGLLPKLFRWMAAA